MERGIGHLGARKETRSESDRRRTRVRGSVDLGICVVQKKV